ncbi:Tubby c-terminal-like domain, partial [Globisporangium splendens]
MVILSSICTLWDEFGVADTSIPGYRFRRDRSRILGVNTGISAARCLFHQQLGVHNTLAHLRYRTVHARHLDAHEITHRCAWPAVNTTSEKKTLLDANNVPIANMKEEFFALMPSYNVYTGSSSSGSPLLNIHCRFTLLNTDLRVEFTDKATGKRCRMGLEGSWIHRNATIWLDRNGRQETVAKIYRSLTAARNVVLGAQDYYVQVSPNVDLALITLVCIVLDEKASD